MCVLEQECPRVVTREANPYISVGLPTELTLYVKSLPPQTTAPTCYFTLDEKHTYNISATVTDDR